MFTPASRTGSQSQNDATPRAENTQSATYAFANSGVSREWNVQLGGDQGDPTGGLNPEAMPYRPLPFQSTTSPGNAVKHGSSGVLYNQSSAGFTESRSFTTDTQRTASSLFSGLSGAMTGSPQPHPVSQTAKTFNMASQPSFSSMPSVHTPPPLVSGDAANKNSRTPPGPPPSAGQFGLPMYLNPQHGMPPPPPPPPPQQQQQQQGRGGPMPMIGSGAGWMTTPPCGPGGSPNTRPHPGPPGMGIGMSPMRPSPSLGTTSATALAADIQSVLTQVPLPAALENCGAPEEEMGALRVILQTGYRVPMIPPPLTIAAHLSIWRRNHELAGVLESAAGAAPGVPHSNATATSSPPTAGAGTEIMPDLNVETNDDNSSTHTPIVEDDEDSVVRRANTAEPKTPVLVEESSLQTALQTEDSLPALLRTAPPDTDDTKERLEAYVAILKRWYHHIVALLAVQSGPAGPGGEATRSSCPSLESVLDRLEMTADGPHTTSETALLYAEWSADCEGWWKEHYGTQHVPAHHSNSSSAFGGVSGRHKRESQSGTLGRRSPQAGSGDAADSPRGRQSGTTGGGNGGADSSESSQMSPMAGYASMMAMMMSAAAQHQQQQQQHQQLPPPSSPQPRAQPPYLPPPPMPQQQQQQRQGQQQNLPPMMQPPPGYPMQPPQQQQQQQQQAPLNFNLGMPSLPDLATTAMLQQQAASSNDPSTVNQINALLLQHLLLQQHQLLQQQQQQQQQQFQQQQQQPALPSYFAPGLFGSMTPQPGAPAGSATYPFQSFPPPPLIPTGQDQFPCGAETRQENDTNNSNSDTNQNVDYDQLAIAFTADLLQNLDN